MKTFARVLGIIGATLLSILLVVMLIVAPLYSAAMSATKPTTITSVIRNIDYVTLLPDTDGDSAVEGGMQDAVDGRARGLLWLGIDTLIACVVLFAAYIVLGGGELILSILGADTTVSAVLLPLVGAVSKTVLVAAIILAVVGLACIGGYIAYTILAKKRAVPTESTVEPLPETPAC